MKASAFVVLTISGLSSLAAATNIIGYVAGDCFETSAFKTCHDVGPGFCCNVFRGGPGAASGKFVGKKKSTKAGGYLATRDGKVCGDLLVTGGKGATSLCLKPIHGAAFAGLKIIKSSKRAKRAAAEEECKSVLPDTLGLADGHKFNLTSMTEEEGDQLWGLAAKGASFDSIPAKYLQHQIP